jgi:hypothetical protein
MGTNPGKIVVPLAGGYKLAIEGDPNGMVVFHQQNGGPQKRVCPSLSDDDLFTLMKEVLSHQWTAQVAPHNAVPFLAAEAHRNLADFRREIAAVQPSKPPLWGVQEPPEARREFKQRGTVIRGDLTVTFSKGAWVFSRDEISYLMLVDLLAAFARDELLQDDLNGRGKYCVAWLVCRPASDWKGVTLSPTAAKTLPRVDLERARRTPAATTSSLAGTVGVTAKESVEVLDLPPSEPLSPGRLVTLLQGLTSGDLVKGLDPNQLPSLPSLLVIAEFVREELLASGVSPEPLLSPPPTLSVAEREELEARATRELIAPQQAALEQRALALASREQALQAGERKLQEGVSALKQQEADLLEGVAVLEGSLREQANEQVRRELEIDDLTRQLGALMLQARECSIQPVVTVKHKPETEAEKLARLRRENMRHITAVNNLAQRVHRVDSGSRRNDLSDKEVQDGVAEAKRIHALGLFTHAEVKTLTRKGFLQS